MWNSNLIYNKKNVLFLKFISRIISIYNKNQIQPNSFSASGIVGASCICHFTVAETTTCISLSLQQIVSSRFGHNWGKGAYLTSVTLDLNRYDLMAHFKHQPCYKFKQFKLIKQCLNCLIAHLESLMCPNIAIPYSLHGGKKEKKRQQSS